MNFRTEIDIDRWQHPIDYHHNILSLGSCFADNISAKLRENKFRVTASPTGILFNPASIASALERIVECREVSSDELILCDGRYVSYDFHSSLGGESPESALQIMNKAIGHAHRALQSTDFLILTLGTAWVYRLNANGDIVANCHKQPQRLFHREMLGVEEIADIMSRVIEQLPRPMHITLTVSPVRHLGDGLAGNSLSKATLRLAIEELTKRHDNVGYFPSYEILMDDLRDYRFYAEDMTHPSPTAIEYIAKRFFDAALSPRAKELMPQIRQIVRAAQHRPLNPKSEEHKAFCRKQLAAIKQLAEIDFSEEKGMFERILQINL